MQLINELYQKYKQDIFVYLVGLTHNPTLSEDLLSETFVGVIKSLANFKGNSDIKTWLFSIARYKWYEHLRKDKSMKNIDIDSLAEIYITDCDELVSNIQLKETLAKINSILANEPQRTQKIVQMRIEGYSYYEIAQKLGITESSARVIDFRAKKKLKLELEKENY